MQKMNSSNDNEHSRYASNPKEISPKGWKDILLRVFQQIGEDNLDIVAAGVTYFAFLAIFPTIAAVISLYGIIAEPQTVQQQLSGLTSILPSEAHEIIKEQLHQIVNNSSGALSWGLLISILLSIWSANGGMSALVKGLNIAYDQELKRNFIKGNALTLLFTVGGIVVVIISMALIVGLALIINNLGLPKSVVLLLMIVRWLILAIIIMLSIALLYRYAPDRKYKPKWQWVSWGSAISTVLWLIGSWGFSFYISHFGNYNATYGSLAAVVILLLWFYLTSFIILLGAEINAEMEHQTKRDTTEGKEKPLGDRGAYPADDVGKSS